MRFLVTGGAGFIGSNFVHHLLESSSTIEVTTLDSLTYAGDRTHLNGVLDDPRHEFIKGDIRDREIVEKITKDVDIVVNFAAESHVDRSIRSSEPFVSTNIQGTQVLLDAATDNGIDLFVQISTDEVYGEILEGRFSEDDPLAPRNPYAATKAGADLLVRSYHVTYDLPIVITRSSNNFGPRQHREKLIPKLITNAYNDEPLPIYGDGTNVREWLYVRDNCRAIKTVIESGEIGEVYNIGGGEERRNVDVARAVVDHLDKPEDLIEFVDNRPGHDQRYALDTSKITALDWEPKWSFDEGLERTIEYYLDETKGE